MRHVLHSVLAFSAAIVAAGLIVSGCGSTDSGSQGTPDSDAGTGQDGYTPPPGDAIRILGHVVESGGSSGGSYPLSDVEIVASVDRNGDGVLAPDEQVSGASDSDGAFEVNVPVDAGQMVVVSFRYDGMAPAFRTIKAGPNAEATLNVSLAALAELTCSSGRCAMAGNLLSLDGLPDGATGYAQIFNPVTQPDRFPGGFEESTGKMLISGVFSSVELTDDAGDPLRELTSPATLRMAVPMDTWNILKDIQPGSDRVEVPLYSFDEILGTWVRDGEGYLEDADGNVIPESDLASIRDGSYSGGVVATGEVTHFSYWNVDWPVDSHQCIGGRITDASNNPVEGAVVSVRGATYNGASTPVTTGADGHFCVDVMRSEGPGEDVDQDGTSGETQSVSIRVTHGGGIFDGGVKDVMTEAATCGEGGCTDVGDVPVTEEHRLAVAVCAVTGTVRDRTGAPIEGASIYAFDESLETEAMAAVCGDYYENCTFFGASGPDGSYSVSTAMLDGLTIFGSAQYNVESGHDAIRQGQRFLTECPKAPVDLTLDEGYDTWTLTVDVAGNVISWVPNLPASILAVSSDAGDTKWQIMTDANGFTGPVTYGTTPAGATAVFPVGGGAPPALASGDVVALVTQGTTADGYMLIGQGEGYVP